MGCDIHGWVEYDWTLRWGDRNKCVVRQPRWHPLIDAGLMMSRNYTLFSDLFGVRNYDDVEPMIGERGLPEEWEAERNAEYQNNAVKDYFDGEADWHSPSWATWYELRDYFNTANPNYKYIGGDWLTLIRIIKTLAEQYTPTGVRLVVWFDN